MGMLFIPIVAYAITNRVYGDKSLLPAFLPGRSWIYASPLLLVFSLWWTGLSQWKIAVVVWLAMTLRVFVPHGRWYSYGSYTPPREPNTFEKFVEKHVPSFFVRLVITRAYMFPLATAAFLLGYKVVFILLLFAPFATAAVYWVACRPSILRWFGIVAEVSGGAIVGSALAFGV